MISKKTLIVSATLGLTSIGPVTPSLSSAMPYTWHPEASQEIKQLGHAETSLAIRVAQLSQGRAPLPNPPQTLSGPVEGGGVPSAPTVTTTAAP